MPFALYMIGYLVFMAVVVWAAVVAGVPPLYLTVGALVLIVAGVLVALARGRSRRDRASAPPR